MTPRVNRVLEDIRQTLEQEGGDDDAVAFGPTGADSTDAGTEAQAGTGAAINPSDASDTLDQYLTDIADLLVLEYGKNDNEAMNFVFSAASQLARDGLVPDMPEDSAAPEEIAIWLGKAKSVQFSSHVLGRARAMLKK